MAEIRVLETRKTEINKSVVETLEEMLAKARAGNVAAVAVVYVHPDLQTTGAMYSQTDCLAVLTGAATTLVARLVDDLRGMPR